MRNLNVHGNVVGYFSHCGGLLRSTVAIVALLLITGCGKGLDSAPQTPPEFAQYFAAFDAAAAANGSSARALNRIRIEFGAVSSADTSGECHKEAMDRYITASESDWVDLTDSGREALIFHELGHCLLNRDHLNTEMTGVELGLRVDGIVYESVMNAHVMEGSMFDALRNYYESELFRGE